MVLLRRFLGLGELLLSIFYQEARESSEAVFLSVRIRLTSQIAFVVCVTHSLFSIDNQNCKYKAVTYAAVVPINASAS